MHILLFDIDGTLLNTGGAGQSAMEKTLAAEFGMTRPIEGISTAGRTDRGITQDLFKFYDIVMSDENWDRFHDRYTDNLKAALNGSPGQILPGIPELLAALQARDDVTMGLLTGNFEHGARIKLEHYALDEFFEFGGYGDHHADRDDIARDVFRVLQSRHGDDIDTDRVWVIGDTPHDVQCGRAIGARVAAVGTGMFALETLAESQPDHLFEDFSEYERLLAMLV